MVMYKGKRTFTMMYKTQQREMYRPMSLEDLTLRLLQQESLGLMMIAWKTLKSEDASGGLVSSLGGQLVTLRSQMLLNEPAGRALAVGVG